MLASGLYPGVVTHTRLKPRRHALRYDIFMLLLDLDELEMLDRGLKLFSLRRFSLSWLLADAGALDEARALATRLAEFGRAQRDVIHESRGRWVLAEVLLVAPKRVGVVPRRAPQRLGIPREARVHIFDARFRQSL